MEEQAKKKIFKKTKQQLFLNGPTSASFTVVSNNSTILYKQ